MDAGDESVRIKGKSPDSGGLINYGYQKELKSKYPDFDLKFVVLTPTDDVKISWTEK